MGEDEFKKQKAWGLSAAVDLHDCDPQIVENPDEIRRYVKELCDLIDMKRYKDTQIVYFGPEKEGYQGYTAYQLIETSNISAHFGLYPDKKSGYGYIDIFSCKPFEPKKAAEFTKEFFKAKSYNMNVMYRRYWFEEKLEAEEGRGLRIEIDKKLEETESQFQKIQVFKTKPFGKMLALDGIVAFTEYDEFAYNEMAAHVPLNVHPNPKRVLIIGGGDGGVAREAAKHKEVEEIHVCDLDEKITEISKKHFPEIAKGLSDPRVKMFFEDGSKFIKQNKGYDVIIIDSQEPVLEESEPLFKTEFYRDLEKALNEEGIAVTQAESMYYKQKQMERLSKIVPKIFPLHWYYYTMVPTYPSGATGFYFCSKKYHPVNDFKEEKADGLTDLKYYNSKIHKGSFYIPTFIKDKIK